MSQLINRIAAIDRWSPGLPIRRSHSEPACILWADDAHGSLLRLCVDFLTKIKNMTTIMSVPTRVADLSRWRKILPHPARTTAVPCVVRLRCETCVRTNEQKCQRFVTLTKLVRRLNKIESVSTCVGKSRASKPHAAGFNTTNLRRAACKSVSPHREPARLLIVNALRTCKVAAPAIELTYAHGHSVARYGRPWALLFH